MRQNRSTRGPRKGGGQGVSGQKGKSHDYRGYMPELREGRKKALPKGKSLRSTKRRAFGQIDDDRRSKKIQKQNLFKANSGTRLNKYIADCGICSRRKADQLIEDGVVKVNRKVVSEHGYQVMPGDFVTVKGDPIYAQNFHIYILLNKPKDVITTSNDEYNRRTVMDIIGAKRQRLFPVGRLDRNTTGAILITNDGEMANRLTHPKYHIRRTYNVKLDKELTQEMAQMIAEGVEVDGKKTAPCELVVSPDSYSKCAVTLIEGRNHEVKKMFEAVGYSVKQLDRKIFANLSTAGMNRGRYRHLTQNEIRELKEMTGMI